MSSVAAVRSIYLCVVRLTNIFCVCIRVHGSCDSLCEKWIRDSSVGVVTSLWRSCLSQQEQEILFSKESITSLESKELPIQRVLGILSMDKVSGKPYSHVLRGVAPPLPYSFIVQCLIKHREVLRLPLCMIKVHQGE